MKKVKIDVILYFQGFSANNDLVSVEIRDLETIRYLVEELDNDTIDELSHEEYSVLAMFCTNSMKGKMDEFYVYVCELIKTLENKYEE